MRLRHLVIIGLALAVCATGCSTPLYSAEERGNRIVRNMGLEYQMMQDDIDTVLLLRPLTGLSNVPIR
jgi:hypothetical protein